MEMHQVRYFLSLCETLSFTRAAEQCHVSQPALTTAIRKLEEEAGGRLFHRDAKRLILTELGRMMRPHLEQLHGQAEAARTIAANFRLLNQVPLTLGVMSTIGPLRLARLLGRFRREQPGVEIAIHDGKLAELTQRLDSGELDLAVLGNPAPYDAALRADKLYTERYVVALPPGHRLEAQEEVKLADVSGEPYVDRLSCELRDMVSAVCRDRKVDLYATFRSTREDMIQGMVMAGIGFAFLPEYSVTQDGIVARPLVDPPVARTVSLVRRAGRKLSPAADAFARAARLYAWPG